MSNNETVSTRVITIKLRMPALVLFACILLGVLIWAFVLGVMVGRGQMNDELAALMPAPVQSQNVEEEIDKEADEVAGLIKSEDLKFQENLRQNQLPEEHKRTPAVDPGTLADAARRDSGQTITPSPKPNTANGPQGSSQVTSAPASAQKYSYLYQVASYNKEDQAKEMQAKLKAKGLNAQTEASTIKGTTWYRVIISFNGDDSNVAATQELLKKEFKINSILPRSKTPLDR